MLRAKPKEQLFTYVSARKIDRLKSLTDETADYQKNNCRTLSDYNSALKIDLGEEILAASERTGLKINIVDAGCGKAIAINELLCYESLKPYINRIFGISKNYFSAIATVLNNHPQKFKYYIGTAQDVIAANEFDADIILDVFGAFAYSGHSIALLEQYYDTLTLGGKAFIYDGFAGATAVHSKLCEKLPAYFERRNESAIAMTKRTMECPFYACPIYGTLKIKIHEQPQRDNVNRPQYNNVKRLKVKP